MGPSFKFDQMFFEDVVVGERFIMGEHRLTKEEIIEFALAWDPMPFHIDEDLAKASHFGGLIAAGSHLMSLRMKICHTNGISPNVIASAGYDHVRFENPAYVGDLLTLHVEVLEKRESKSKPDRGYFKLDYRMLNEAGETTLSHTDTIFIRKRK